MDFRYGEAQEAAAKAAAAVFGADQVDTWRALAAAGLTGLALSEDVGGAGCGVLEVCALLVEQGRRLATVPAVESILVAGPAIARFGPSGLLPEIARGDVVAVPAFGEARADGNTLTGSGLRASYGRSADLLLVSAGADTFLVDAERAELHDQVTTSGRPQVEVALDGVPGERLGAGSAEFVRTRSTVGICAQQVGMLEEALRLTASYTSEREQFGRPIATFQAVTMRAADAHADVETARVAMWRAAWLLAAGEPADSAVAVAKYWAAEAGYRVTSAAQHLHGGIGVSTDYPLHRYTLWARQNELAFGGATEQLARLGAQLADDGPAS